MDILVSVVCATYNHGPFIKDALDGFLMQQCSFPYEIIVHDDASTDNTADIIREYTELYPGRIKAILQTENQRSKKIPLRDNLYSHAKGKYVAICEGDDYWTDPLKLQKQIDALEAHPDIDICAACTAIESNGVINGKCAPSSKDTVFTPEQVILGGGDFVATCSLVIDREVFMSMPEYRKILGIDYVHQITGSLRGGMLYLADCMSVYRYFVPGSWSVVHVTDLSKMKVVNEKICLMLEKLDEETNGKYNDTIRYKIKEIHYIEYNNNGEFGKLLSREMREVYRRQPRKARLKVWIKFLCPWLVDHTRKRRVRKLLKNNEEI